MDEQKKQKVIIGVLAVLMLGAGSFWYMSRETTDENMQQFKSGPVVRKERKKADQSAKKTRKKRVAKAPSERKAFVRKQRDDSERTSATRKKRRRSGAKKVKKDKLVPAS